MIEYFSSLFGPYPFEAYGVAVVDADWDGALETQTLPLFGGARVRADPANELEVAKAVAHQWFGNSISPYNCDNRPSACQYLFTLLLL